jgi:hypothetical protein
LATAALEPPHAARDIRVETVETTARATAALKPPQAAAAGTPHWQSRVGLPARAGDNRVETNNRARDRRAGTAASDNRVETNNRARATGALEPPPATAAETIASHRRSNNRSATAAS